ncbi:carbohydrate ABC transporter permease [Paenibacillus nasutitermitis]|uniref:Sugar ABC transporter permease n=1 Tax=Paenibacillus nasutitermitis TaxID=1652958 RepID=A0A916YJ94_9BACL|nr:sugar ABC transporter permease [Paenibacillus nasutitermitis]GGD47379.1 sugar ABC transporter permease [Paenibacillus nasutitermitis]
MKSYTSLTGYLFISPFLFGFFLLTLYPALQSLYFSFTDYSLLEPASWVGMDNYKRMFTEDPNFSKSLGITFTYVIFAVPLKLLFALLVAIVLNKQIKGMSYYRTIMYLPSLIGGSIAVAVLWKNIFGAEGFISKLLALFGIENMSMVTNPETALSTLIILQAWQFGSAMIIFLAGLKQIPKELYEASAVDGASKVRQFFSVTLTMLSPVILFNLILGLIGSFQMFTQAFVITKGGPLKSTYMYALYLYEKAFGAFQMGYASALAWVLLLIIAAATAINFAISKYWVFYESEGGK